MTSGKKLKKRVALVFFVGTLVSTTLWCADNKPKPYQAAPAEDAQSGPATPSAPAIEAATSPDSSTNSDGKIVEAPPAASTLNLQLPKQDAALTESDIVLPDSPHDIKTLLSGTQKTKESPINVSGGVFLDEDEKKTLDPNTGVMDQVKGGEVKVKLKTK